MEIIIGIVIAILVISALSIKIVPQQEAWIVQNFGKFSKVLEPGLNILTPFIQVIAYKHTLKEQAMDVTAQTAISNDNVTLSIDGVLYVKIVDPVAASYGVNNPYYAISQLAQTTMRSEIGKLPLDRTFEEREMLNSNIVYSINQAALNWGIQCMRYEIKDIQPPQSVLKAMELQVAAERQKRAEILQSEGMRQSKINNAEAHKAEVVLHSEAMYIDITNRAKGEAESIGKIAEATANSIELLSKAIDNNCGEKAIALKLGEKYIETLALLANKNNTMIVPANIMDPTSMIAQGTSIFKNITKNFNNE